MKAFTFVFAILFSIFLNAQDYKHEELRLELYTGFVSKNYSKLHPASPAFIGEISYSRMYSGKKEWHAKYKYPTFYTSLFFGYPGNKIYGYFIGISPQFSMKFPISKNFNYSVKAGIGPAYHTNPWDVDENPLNMLVGSRITAIANAHISLDYKFGKSVLGLSLGVIHFSNGHVKLPNIGTNMPVAGINFKILGHDRKSFSQIEILKTELCMDKSIRFFVGIGAGVHEYGSSTKPANGPKYLIKTLSFGLTKNTNLINQHYFGLNILQYNSFKKFIITEELNIGNPYLKSMAITAFWGHEFQFGKFGFYTEIGLDIYKPFYKYFVTIYGDKFGAKDVIKAINSNKMGIRYKFIDKDKFGVVAGTNLKVNMGQADFIEIFCSFEF
jgi:hypothetical protein